MKKVYDVGVKEVEKILSDIEAYQAEQKRKMNTFLSRMAELGATAAKANFRNALYAGENDVQVRYEQRGTDAVAVVAIGEATLFIEFGAGITYPDDHPDKPSQVTPRGQYGKKKGSRKTWGYFGKPGNLGIESKTKPGLVLTHGSPANMCMYKAERKIEAKIAEIAKEVFGNG